MNKLLPDLSRVMMSSFFRLGQAGWLPLCILLGVAARLLVANRPHNFDFESYTIVANIIGHNGNVYAETTRYNYGPIWFNILHVFNQIASFFPDKQDLLFRYLLVTFLTLADVGIFVVLWKKVGKTAACLFFLNPISIIITGYHHQFDNVALFWGMLAVIIFGDGFAQPINKRKGLGLLVLGLSLITKHILFAFPFWLAVKQKGWWHKTTIMIIPTLLFF